MERRKAVWYSIIRYSPNELNAEIINVGLILHSTEDKARVKLLMLDENSNKLRAVIGNKVGLNTYKTYKEALEYYLMKSKDDLSGTVGAVTIASYYDPDFLNTLRKYYENRKLQFTEPNFAFTENVDMLFESLFTTYIGAQYLQKEATTMTAKKIMKDLFEQKNLLGRKVKSDILFNPIETLEDLQLKIDFSFKNGVWNYLQTVPSLSRPAQNSEWFAKTKLLIDNLEEENSKIHILYRHSDFSKNEGLDTIVNYLVNHKKISKINIDDNKNVTELCEYIEKEAEEIEEYRAS